MRARASSFLEPAVINLDRSAKSRDLCHILGLPAFSHRGQTAASLLQGVALVTRAHASRPDTRIPRKRGGEANTLTATARRAIATWLNSEPLPLRAFGENKGKNRKASITAEVLQPFKIIHSQRWAKRSTLVLGSPSCCALSRRPIMCRRYRLHCQAHPLRRQRQLTEPLRWRSCRRPRQIANYHNVSAT